MATPGSCHQSCRAYSTCPAWLQAALADIEQRVRTLALSSPEDENSDSFAERAESYYQKRPQLLSLVQDLHNRYLYLADRYSISLLKPQHHKISTVHSEISDDDPEPPDSISSDAESSISFHPPLTPNNGFGSALDPIITELVFASVERNLLMDEKTDADRYWSESSRKMELQRSLLEVLESERTVLVTENARLGFRAAAAEEEGRSLAAEVGYMRRKAAELARSVVKMREDYRVCLLGRKIEGLQAQIYGLERRNRVKREREKGEMRVEMERLRDENRRLRAEVGRRKSRRRTGRVDRWWGRVWRMEWSPCWAQVKGRKGCFYF